MKFHLFVASIILALSTSPSFAMTDQAACKKGEPDYSKEGVTKKECLCMLDQAGKTMPPKMKTVFVESLLSNKDNPMAEMMGLGIPTDELMGYMQSYGRAVKEHCGI